MAESAALLVDEVVPEQPVRQWVLSFPFQLRFLFASRPEIMGCVLGIVYRVIATHLVKKTGHTYQAAMTGAVTLIQRFGGALNLNIHFHMLFLDGVYVDRLDGSARFRWVKAPTSAELTQLAHTIAHRVGRFLERLGLLERDMENSYLASDAVDDDPMTPLPGHSITYRIAIGPQAGRKVFTLQTLPPSGEPFDDEAGKVAGFSLHAGVAARADERKKLERMCRYISRPAVSAGAEAACEPYPVSWCVRAQQPAPGVADAGKAGMGNSARVSDEPPMPADRRASKIRASRLKPVFNIDIETCTACGVPVKVIAGIEDPVVIKQILAHLKHKAESGEPEVLPESRAPPAELHHGLFDCER